ncbi:baseplate J/gp47 family protein [Flavisphingomonas formosensis]|uniref:baseplate J/gp47 family protein n=1 Tax=Flavisphingomonas formosensis TaxID=861534 RepID=UPI0012FA7C3D|nr:baseplate J/gp47 family protein [Sphingomonas formosensis]
MADDLKSISPTTVDLSRLPAPTVVVQMGYEDIRAQLVAKMVALTTAAGLAPFDATVESDPVVKLIEDFAYRELLLRADFNDRARQLLLAYAQKSNLDHLGALFNVERLVVTPASDSAVTVYEDDDSFRQRILLSVEALSVAGPEAAYVYHAKSARIDIADASATSPSRGAFIDTLVASFQAAGGTEEQVAAVRATIDAIAWPATSP